MTTTQVDALMAQIPTPEICDSCKGVGLVHTGYSGLEIDGNAPLSEPCDSCGGAGCYITDSARLIFRAALTAALAPAEEPPKPYAYEFAASNGDGTYSTHIEHGEMSQVRKGVWECVGPPRHALKDHPITPLYASPGRVEQAPAYWLYPSEEVAAKGKDVTNAEHARKLGWFPVYTRPQQPTEHNQAELQRGFDRYEKARKLNPRQWAELHQRNIAGESFDDMIDALPPVAPVASQPVRMLNKREREDCMVPHPANGDEYDADLLQEKFAEVNGITIGAPQVAVPEGWSLTTFEDWAYIHRPGGLMLAVTPDEPSGSHAETLYLLIMAMIASPSQTKEPV